jgi:hypothetical protein
VKQVGEWLAIAFCVVALPCIIVACLVQALGGVGVLIAVAVVALGLSGRK